MRKLSLALLLLIAAIYAQSGNVDIIEVEKQTDCQTIYTTVCVFDSNGWYLPELQISDFVFYENGTPVVPPNLEMLNECESGCVDIAMLLDLSGSMDDNIAQFYSALSVFADGLSGVDYRICMSVYNGCPAEWDAVRKLVHTDFTSPPPDTTGPDVWAANEFEFSLLFAAVQEYYSLPWSARGSGYEDQYGALYWAMDTLDWRPGCRKAVVLFTDEEVQVDTLLCSPAYSFDDSSLYEMIDICHEESVTVFSVCPEDSNMQWYPLSGDDPSRQYYAGYRILAESTSGIWSDLYDTAYTEMVQALAYAIADIPCCYFFRYLTDQYCLSTGVELAVDVSDSGLYIGSDDSNYISYCQPEFQPIRPYPCGGITSCDELALRILHNNSEFGNLVATSLKTLVNDDTVYSSDITYSGDSLVFNSPGTFAHCDTVVYSLLNATNEWGCLGLMQPCTFYVDLLPPEIVDRYPGAGDTLIAYGLEISADMMDFFAGIDSLSVPGNISITLEGVELITSIPEWEIRGDTVRVKIDSIDARRDGLVTVCVADLYDNIDYDYCPPNVMPEDCWQFYVYNALRKVDFPVQYGDPCDTVLIPLNIDGLEYSIIESANMRFWVDSDVLIPLDIVTDDAITDTWSVDSVWTDSLAGEIYAEISGSPISGGLGGDLLYLKALVDCSAHGGDYTDIVIEDFTFNEGFPRVEWTGGFFIVNYTPQIFTCDLHLNRIESPAPEDHVITFGAMPSATENYDPGTDIQLIPPPDYMVCGFFPIEDSSYPFITRLMRDIRQPIPPAIWTVISEHESTGEFRWVSSSLPEGEFRFNSIVDMKRDSLAVFADNDTNFIEWYFPELEPLSFGYNSGWNLVSTPILPTAVTPDDFFQTAMGVFRYRPDILGYEYTHQIRQGEGYWVWYDSLVAFNAAGGSYSSYNREISPGWNLIGAISTPISVFDIDIVPAGGIIGDIYGWNGIDYYPADSLFPGEGYWLLSSNSGVLEVPSSSSRAKTNISRPEWTGVIQTIDKSNDMTLTIGYDPLTSSELSSGDIAIPPPIPGKGYPVISLVGDKIDLSKDLSSDGHWNLKVRENSTLKFSIPENIKIKIDSTFFCDGQISLFKQGEYKLAYSPRRPEKFAILGCVPNPFNAKTEITLRLPEPGQVRLEIYDIIGKKVRRIEGNFENTVARVIWDGRDNNGLEIPSGIYFIRAIQDEDSDIKRAILIK